MIELSNTRKIKGKRRISIVVMILQMNICRERENRSVGHNSCCFG
jgi:hypothetical protein